jgi:hypothetical protein
MHDPFLGEAIEGFDAVAGDHLAAMEALAERVHASAVGGRAAARAHTVRRREKAIKAWSVAVASLFVAMAVGGSVWLLGDGLSPTRPRLAPHGEYSRAQEQVMMPPVTVIPNEAAPTDASSLTLDSRETGDFSGIASVRDTTLTASFRRYVQEFRSTARGQVVLSFEVSAEGRPLDVAVVESSSTEASEVALTLLSRGPDWPREPARKLITINL